MVGRKVLILTIINGIHGIIIVCIDSLSLYLIVIRTRTLSKRYLVGPKVSLVFLRGLQTANLIFYFLDLRFLELPYSEKKQLIEV